MIYLILKLTTSLLFMFCCAWVDSELHRSGYRFHSHASRFFLRGCFMLVVGNFNLWNVLGYSFVFAAFFDFTLNLLNGDKPLYLGTQAWWDQRVGKLPSWAHVSIKVGLLFGGMYLIFLK